MKVVYVLNPTLRLSGSFKSFSVLLRGLMQHGVQPSLVIPKGQDYEDELRKMGIPVLALTYRDHAWPHSGTASQKLLFVPRLIARGIVNAVAGWQLYRHFRGKGIDLVHTNVSVLGVGYTLARRLGVPHVYHVREYGKEDFGIRPFPSKSAFDHRLRQPGAYTICITRDLLRHHHLEGLPSARMIYNGICPRMDVMPPASTGDYFLFVGPLTRAKGIDQLVEAYVRYTTSTQRCLPLKVVGHAADPELFGTLTAKLKAHSLSDKVIFLGNRSDVPELMRDAAALIVPSPSEGFGRCTAEAMFSGTLVIGRNTGGTKEQMDNGLEMCGHEIALRYEDTAQLAARMDEVATAQSGSYNEMRLNAFNTVNALYTNEAYVANVLDFYDYILPKAHLVASDKQ